MYGIIGYIVTGFFCIFFLPETSACVKEGQATFRKKKRFLLSTKIEERDIFHLWEKCCQLNKYVWNHWLYCYRFFLQKNLFLKVICK
jgi:hypothetical protein